MSSLVVPTIFVHEWVTGGGLSGSSCPTSLAVEGAAMRRVVASEFAALPPVGARVVMTIDARWPDEPGPWTVVRASNRESPQIVRALAREADYTVLIAPETMHVLAELTRGLELAGANSLGSTVEAVETTGNKLALATLLESQGIDIPRSRKIVPADGLPRDLAYPAVLKPVDGAGSIDTYYLCDSASLPEEARQMPLAMLQPFVPDVPMSASFLADGTGQAWLVGVGRQKISIRESRIQYDGGILPWPCDEAVPLLRTAVESTPGLRGFVGIDFLWDLTDHKTTVLE